MRAAVVAFLMMFPVLAVAECTAMTASGNAEYPPYLWRPAAHPDQLEGAIARLMQDLAARTGIPVRTVYAGPWGRTQEEVAAGHIDLIAGAFYTDARAKRMDYLKPAFQQTRSVLWVRKEHSFAYSQLSDLIGKRGVTVINNSFGQEFDQFAKDNLEILQVGALEQALRMISNGRVDYMVYEEQPGLAYMQAAGIDKLMVLDTPVSSEALYLTMSLKSDCNTPEIKARLQQALQDAAGEGVMNTYLQQARAQWQTR